MSELKQKIMSSVSHDLDSIEAALKQNLNPHLNLVATVAGHILFSGGKRLRPLLMVLSARLCGYQGSYDKPFAVIFEYLHAATLLHDDLVDDAALRRGKPAAHTVWDNPTAVLVGDFLLARSLVLAAETGLPELIKVIAGITEDMSQGEIQQLSKKGDPGLTETEYLEIIHRKTAVLFQGACLAGALLAGADKISANALAQYGLNLGMAFQMADDLLDYTIDTSAIGKNVGADLKEGKLTLPVIFAIRSADSFDKQKMLKIIKDQNFNFVDFCSLIDLLNKYGGIDYTKQCAARYIKQAKKALMFFKPGKIIDIFLDIADYSLVRKL